MISVLILLCISAQAVLSTEELEERSCYDSSDNCADYASYCSDSAWKEHMKKSCAQTCGLCGGGGGSTGGGCKSVSSKIPQGSCGTPSTSPMRRSAISSYIVGGKEAKPHSLPWQISVQTPSGFHFCGATILSANVVLTAAHCVKPGDNIFVKAGAHSKKNDGQKYKVQQIIQHSQYNKPRQLNNDIAILKIGGSGIKLDSNAMPACLPPACHEWGLSTQFIVSGWGTQSFGGKSPDKLMQVTVPIVEHGKCARQNSFRASWKKVVCAGFDQGGKDSCQGDSGGPLVAKLNGKFTLAGVVSYGKGCAKANYPGVYTHVSHYIDWINANI